MPATSTTTEEISQPPSFGGTIPSRQESANVTQSQLLMILTARPMNMTWNSKGTPWAPRATLGDGSLFRCVGSIRAHKVSLFPVANPTDPDADDADVATTWTHGTPNYVKYQEE